MNSYFDKAVAIAPLIIKSRRHLHSNPEIGMNLPNTWDFVYNNLVEMGYNPVKVGKCGISATVGKSGKTFLLRGDMDALAISEESGLEFASTNPNMGHCCGHDLHTAMLLGAAKLLKDNESGLNGTVKLMFQPGEETLEGARDMIDNGILENPSVDAAMAIHVNSTVPCGAIIVFHGQTTASSDRFTITVKGKGCHGSRPNEGIDPIAISCYIHTALNELQSRELKAGETGVLTIGSIHGGTISNAIPNEVEMQGTIRTFNNETREMIIRRMKEISTAIAQAFRGEADIYFEPLHSIPMVCDEVVSSQVNQSLREIFSEKQVRYLSQSFPGAEDFAFIADKVPTSFIVLGASIGENVEFGQHHPKVQFNEKCLPIGAAIYAQVATKWLENN